MTGIRLRQAAPLTRPVARSLHRLPLIACPALAFGVAALPRDPALQARLGAMVLCLSAAFLLDDPARATIAAVPLPLLTRRIHRVAIWLPALAVLWGLLLWYTAAPDQGSRTVELAGMLAITAAAAALLGSAAAGPTVLAILVAGWIPSLGWAHLADDAWTLERGAFLLAVGVSALACVSVDPARRRRLRLPRRAHAPAASGALQG
jgi:hypothetical protein